MLSDKHWIIVVQCMGRKEHVSTAGKKTDRGRSWRQRDGQIWAPAHPISL